MDADTQEILEQIHARERLDEINRFLLKGAGEIHAGPGKISLVWTDPIFDQQRFVAIKAAADHQIFINGRRCDATEADLKQGLLDCLKGLNLPLR